MKIKQLGNTDIRVTPIGMGVLTIGPTQLNLSVEEGAHIVRYALERGINFLDTAEYYRTYPHISRALDELAPSFHQNALPRPVIVSKSLARDYNGMRRSIDECRSALGLDQIDIFLLHEIWEAGDFESRKAAWDCLTDAKADGSVKAIGFSTHHVDAAAKAVEIQGVDVLFPLINYKGIGIRDGGGKGTKEDMAEAIRAASGQGIGVFAMKALGGGHLAKDYQAALDYVCALPGMDSVFIGMGREKDVDDALAYFEGCLPDGFTPETSNKRMFVDRGDCIGCGACVSRCASAAIALDETQCAVIDNSKCVLCGYCGPVCPTRALIFL